MTAETTRLRGPQLPQATVTGYPRIGPNRELKKALESFWAGDITEADLESAAHSLRLDTYARLKDLGLTEAYSIPADFAWYDHVLETAITVGLQGGAVDTVTAQQYFGLARGNEKRAPLEMTKWFDTNYHYLVPEVSGDAERTFTARADRLLKLVKEGHDAGHTLRPVLVGPVTLLALSKAAGAEDAEPLAHLEKLVDAYAEVLAELARANVDWVQLDEPALVADLETASDAELAAAYSRAYERLLEPVPGRQRPQVLVATPYGALQTGLGALAQTPPEAVHVDLSATVLERDPEYAARVAAVLPESVGLVAGVIDGRNVWAADLESVYAQVSELGRSVTVSTGTSLLHVPYSLAPETKLPVDVAGWLSFAEEKVSEVVALGDSLVSGVTGRVRSSNAAVFERSRRAKRTRGESNRTFDAAVRKRTQGLAEASVDRGDPAARRAAQHKALGLPLLPTTTIGSFPQTAEVRRARADYRAGRITSEEYVEANRAEIKRVVDLQEELGLDVLVHGEPERNDMVQYFAEHLEGFTTTVAGWVQSYGSRCTRPPILFGDVSRPAPITVEWSSYTAGLTDKPVKGMLTGPVTILAWSFVRDDVPLAEPAFQLGVALGDEVADLEAAGLPIVQVDEPALRELLPLRAADRQAYLDWAVKSFRLVHVGVAPQTQIHTHLCYSEFNQIIDAIAALDADVTSIEAARSRMELLAGLDEHFTSEIGPGVYDIHSPRVPGVDEIAGLIEAALEHVPADRLWINPDCGLKTRGYAEVEPALHNMVVARDRVVAQLG
ncbi:5-methyltetrahydropteroyltriglutamate--homocysteine S-methyltransferase [Brevibacterium sp. 91QC2O2]|uniref:5-methyltetrahydropteroyltriglutamate-- homocysteine S-methyltransferase n=1 Tax=Brevibacterium sp. 91QC2O2 TaxID=2968458 RepID=UPI00211CD635|nr:5-methyltetrahydropteroyltriglutamate--homocysteine S-methyltransferase [Brevibacterium sp. 91QC2O2]MCQ9368105.1 5-methyltetrahydropteroyltriglutamate--homocysteine S-methyltransferase [Brevibacterium sp. 91QC2O2]